MKNNEKQKTIAFRVSEKEHKKYSKMSYEEKQKLLKSFKLWIRVKLKLNKEVVLK